MSLLRIIALVLSLTLFSSLSYSKGNEEIKDFIDSYNLSLLMPKEDNSGFLLKIESLAGSKVELNKNALSQNNLWIMLWIGYKDKDGVQQDTGGSSCHTTSARGLASYEELANSSLIPIHVPTLAFLDDLEKLIARNEIDPNSIEKVILGFGFKNLIRLPDAFEDTDAVFYPEKITLSKQEILKLLKMDKTRILELISNENSKQN